MLHRFSNFEIDEDQRELRAGGHVVELQRRVFDLLVYLARHRDRVVPKMELLEAVWPGVLVTDNSLQRAISLARAALDEAGCAGTIRTLLRHGYRFCASGDAAEPAKPAALRRAQEAFARSEWDEALSALREIDRFDAFTPDDLKFWALVVQCAGRPADILSSLERAAAGFQAQGDCHRAAWAALLLAQLRLDWREPAPGKGWLRRANRWLAGTPEAREHGYAAFIGTRVALLDNDLDRAVRLADQAREIGRRCADADLESLGLLYGGEARLYRGEVEDGLAAIDEAGATVGAFNLSPWAGGLVYCGIIFSALTRADWHRAGQWNEQFGRWCELSGAPGAMGLCQLHRAEVLCVQGDLAAAEREARQAQATLARASPWAEGDAWRVLGEIQLARGDWAGARASMARAHEYGWNAQLGLAQLEYAQGRPQAARRLLAGALDDPHWANRARRGLLLAHYVMIAAAAGQANEARHGLAELDARPELVSTSALQALTLQARGELALAEGDRARAIQLLRAALQSWTATQAPLDAARTRCRLAQLLAQAGDAESAALELQAARAQFRKSGAHGLLEQCEPKLPGSPPARRRASVLRRSVRHHAAVER